MDTAVINYFNGDSIAASSWEDKYQMKDRQENPVEATPTDMHKRLASEFAKIEHNYQETEAPLPSNFNDLSDFGKDLVSRRATQSLQDIEEELFNYFDRFSKIVPQGSVMSNLGNYFIYGSLSNCFGIAPPSDSYSGICRADQELAQLMKRRGGVGTHLNNLRPAGARVSNAAKTSTGAASFAERYSNTTREVAQEGRRGALMLLLHVEHPEIFKWITMKDDKTKVTGANVSVMFTDDFMFQVESNADDFICKFPVEDFPVMQYEYEQLKEFNKLYQIGDRYFLKIKPKELFEEFVNMAWSNGEPGAAFIDRITDYAPDGVYDAYIPELCNPCGEQWFHRNDTCRLISENLFSIVKNPFTANPEIDYELLYEISYMQQRLGDDLVDLEAIYIDRIINKIEEKVSELSDDDKEESRVEINLWRKIKDLALAGRRTGNGFTALGDTIAALGLRYGSEESIRVVANIMKTKMRAELDCTIDMAILRGTFTGWHRDWEYLVENNKFKGANSFYQMLADEFPDQAKKMYQFGRRNVSWSTVAPTGTVSLMCQTTSGLEPLFAPYSIRRRKINPNDKNTRVDFTDQNGDQWQEYAILHFKFKEWIENTRLFNELKSPTVKSTHLAYHGVDEYTELEKSNAYIGTVNKAEDLPELMLEQFFKNSPWYGSCANDIPFEERVQIQSIVQRYTSNAISSTVNLPQDVSKETVYGIYFQAWKKGLKGITIYRDKSRTGVLISKSERLTSCDEFGYVDAIKRPTVLDADFYYVKKNGTDFAVIVGLLNNNPYEIFAFQSPTFKQNTKGKLIKVGSGHYAFESNNYTIDNVQLPKHSDEGLLTRWASLALRQGANPAVVAEQVDKSEVLVTNFAKAIQVVLKNYIPDEDISGEACLNCGEHTMIYEEGCKKCISCGHSKC